MVPKLLDQYSKYLKIERFHSFLKYEPSSFWFHFKESFVLGLVSWCPGLIGAAIRNLIYRSVFAKLSLRTFIEAGVDFKSAASIYLSGHTTIRCRASVNAWSPSSQIHLHSTHLDTGVDIRAHNHCRIEIAEGTYIGPYSCIAGPGAIRIGKACLIAAHAGIYANNHIFTDLTRNIVDQGVTSKGIVIEDDCWLGTGVKVLDGVTIGRGSVIGAGAVVTKDIPPYSVAVGVPAKVISQRGNNLQAVCTTKDIRGII